MVKGRDMSHKAAPLEEGVDQLGQWRERCADHVADLKVCLFIFVTMMPNSGTILIRLVFSMFDDYFILPIIIRSRLKVFSLQQLLDDCNDRVNSRTNTEETCHQVKLLLNEN